MIGSLRGVLLDRTPEGEALVEVGGVGYLVHVTGPSLAALGDLGNAVFLHVYTHVREDAIVLYGFTSRDERRCFEALLGTHGVGPAVAMAILSVHSPAALRRAVATDDADALTLVPGIGKKTAARLLLELSSRLGVPDLDADLTIVTAASGSPAAEVKAALVQLGYGADEVRAAVHGLPDGDDVTVEDLLRAALRTLAVAR